MKHKKTILFLSLGLLFCVSLSLLFIYLTNKDIKKQKKEFIPTMATVLSYKIDETHNCKCNSWLNMDPPYCSNTQFGKYTGFIRSEITSPKYMTFYFPAYCGEIKQIINPGIETRYPINSTYEVYYRNTDNSIYMHRYIVSGYSAGIPLTVISGIFILLILLMIIINSIC